MGIFGKKEGAQPEWLAELQLTRERLFVFLDKLEDKMQELCIASIPELEALNADKEDGYKHTYFKVRAGVQGQLNAIRVKGDTTYQEKITDNYRGYHTQVSVFDSSYHLLTEVLVSCNERHREFSKKCHDWYERLLATEQEDFELQYQEIVDDYHAIKDTFKCSQCGSGIFVDKIYFITSYLKCPACSSQNVFEPSTKAKGLEHVARSLAEQRTAHLLKRSEKEKERERELYTQAHELDMSLIYEKDHSVRVLREQQIKSLEQQRQESIALAPQLYQEYLRAMFDEWKKLVPDLAEHNERFYESLLRR